MATEKISYVSYPEAVFLHMDQMQLAGEIRYGVFVRSLIESALARPRQAAVYENADLIRQAATLYFGLIKNHPWEGGNKRTASAIVDEFLYRNGQEIVASLEEILQLVLDIEANRYGVDEIEDWLRQRTIPLPPAK
ncbi:MAG: type II toxin-antitoxin system death-on-curing family toxin [Acidobacteriota bacterium]|nr:type II toxin-antitoxin system death-on-curing family toxin [Acidobacteriota bacterium]